MTDAQDPDLRQLLAMVWGQLMRERRWHLAMLTGMLGSQIFRDRADESEELALHWVAKAMEEMTGGAAPASGARASAMEAPSCSFCTRGAPEVRLIAGAKGAICGDCAAQINDTFTLLPRRPG